MTEANKQKLIVVLGMHRSGTSAITRGLKVLGVELGDNFLPPGANDNVKGYWEDFDILTLNIEILKAIGSEWHYLVPVQSGDIEVLRKKGYFLRAVELLHQKIGDAAVWGFKDPRVAKLLPFWKEVLSQCQLDVRYVFAIRNPLSVVKSLAARDGFNEVKSYLLWLGHIIVSLSGTIGEKSVFIDYDHLMQSPDFELSRIAKQFDLKIDPAALQNFKTAFLDKELRHTVYNLNDLLSDDASPPFVHEIYSALLDVASDKTKIDDLSIKKKVAVWVRELERLKSSLAMIDRHTQTIASLNQALAERDRQIGSLKQALAEIESSKSWKLAKVIRKIRIWLIPKDSHR